MHAPAPEDKEDIQHADIPPAYPIEEHIESACSGTEGSELQRQIRKAITAADFDSDSGEVDDPPPAGLVQMMDGLPQWQQRFVCALLDCQGVLQLAARHVGTSMAGVNKARSESEQFDMCIAEALEQCKGIYKATLIQMAVVGCRQPVFQGGIRVGWKRVKDVRALQILLESQMAEEFGPKIDDSDKLTAITESTEALRDCLDGAAKRLFLAAGAVAEQKANAREIG